jgi:N-acetylmuramoyl-L-alanine amidase
MLVDLGGDYPAATWHGSPNYWTGRNGQKVIAIVDHIMQATMESADSWFLNPASEVSAHFGVARDGRVYQWVRLSNSAWANGIMNKPDTTCSMD